LFKTLIDNSSSSTAYFFTGAAGYFLEAAFAKEF
jgi:hypothetical protein